MNPVRKDYTTKLRLKGEGASGKNGGTNGDVYVTGKNRTPTAVIAFLFVWPCCFICGSKAEIPSGYEIQAAIAANTLIKVN